MKSGAITSRQLGILAFLSVLSPIVRLLPNSAISEAGSAAWLSTLLASAAAVFFVILLSFLLRKTGKCAENLFSRSLGAFFGGLFSAIYALWLVFYCGIVLRASVERLVSALYPESAPWLFMIVTAAALTVPLSMKKKALFRAAEIVLPLIVGCLAFVFIFSVKDIRPRFLLPVGLDGAGGTAAGAIPVLEIFSVFAFFLLASHEVSDPERLMRESAKWTGLAGIAAFLLCVVTIGTSSAPLCADFLSPALTVVRNIRLFGTDARVDSVIFAVWVITDLALMASLLKIARELLAALLPKRALRLLPAAEPAAVLLTAVLISGGATGVAFWSEEAAPAVNAVLAALVLPLVLTVGLIRKNSR